MPMQNLILSFFILYYRVRFFSEYILDILLNIKNITPW